MNDIHPNEPKLEQLETLRKELYADNTADNTKKIKAIESQIARHKAAAKSGNK